MHACGTEKVKEIGFPKSENPISLGRINHNLTHNEGQVPYISESGLYNLIMHSNAPLAKEFQKLVCKTILPSIRKYGSYQVESQLSLVMEKLANTACIEKVKKFMDNSSIKFSIKNDFKN